MPKLRFFAACLLGALCLFSLAGASRSAAQSPEPQTPQHLFAAGQFKEARAAYEALFKQNPGNPDLQIGLMCTLLRLDDFSSAVTVGNQAMENGQKESGANNADVDGVFALAILRSGLIDSAQKWVTYALKINPKSYWALVAAGNLALWNDQSDQALHDFRLAAREYPGLPDAWLGILRSFDLQTYAGPAYLQALKALVGLNPQGEPFYHFLIRYRSALKYYRSYWAYYNTHPGFEMVAPAQERAFGEKNPPKVVETTVPFQIKEGWIIVPVTIDGQLFHMVFDTGAGSVLLSKDAADRLHLPVLAEDDEMGMQGEETENCLRAKTMALGDFRFRTIPLIAALSASTFGDGILGGGAFTNYVITIDFTRKVLIFQRGTAAKAPALVSDDQGLTMPFHYVENLIVLPSEVTNTRTNQPYSSWTLLDSGSQYSFLSLSLAQEIAAGLPKTDTHYQIVKAKMGIGSEGISFLGVHQNVDFSMESGGRGMTESANSVVGVSSLDNLLSPVVGAQMSVLFGAPFLDICSKVTVDYPHRTVTFEAPAKSKPESAKPPPSPVK